MQIISRSRRVTEESFDLVFKYVGDATGSGFSFPCTADGTVLPLPDVAVTNYDKCISKEHNVHDGEIRKASFTYTEHAIGKCECRREVNLVSFTNECDCGRLYNQAGQQVRY